MRALVIGHRGMLGTDLMTHLAAEGHDAVGLDLPEIDITDRRQVMRRVSEAAPDVVFHLAAWTDVDGAEENEEQALLVNGEGTRNVAIAARDAGAALVAVSTDYVFPGTGGPYQEDSATDPIQAYGRTKLAGERLAVIEAMKTECDVPSPAAGVVRAVYAREKDAVAAGAPIIALEPA